MNAAKTIPDQDLHVPDRNLQAKVRADRLRQAVKAAGGNRVVSQRSGVPISSLNNYLSGQDMKTAALISLAAACNVSLEWLATGRESDAPAPTPPPASPAPATPGREGYFGTMNMDRLAEAMTLADKAFELRGLHPSNRRKAQVMLLIYDELTEIERSGEDDDVDHMSIASRKAEV